MNDKSKFESLLYSTVGVAVVGIALIAFNYVAGKAKQRVDLTKEKLYTLSDGTKKILSRLDTPVKIRLYVTRGDNSMPPIYSSYAQRVEDLLAEYRQYAKGKLEIEKLDPKPDTEAEDSANLDGVEGQMVNLNEKIYLGLAVSCIDQKVAMPFLNLNREQLLEYDISRAITQVVQPEKPVIGVLSGLPLFGGSSDPMAMMRGQRGAPAWVFITELKRDFEVKQVEATAESIDANVKVLMVVHPKNLTDKTLYAIDQFLMRGGKLMVFVDPLSIMDSAPGMNPLQRTQSASSSLDKLTKAWGLEFDANKVVADMNYKTTINRGQGRPEVMPSFLSLTKEGLATNDVTTSQIDSLLIPFGGAITGEPVAGLKKEVLFKSSDKSQLIEKFMAEFSGEQTTKDFVASGKEYALGVRLTGKFKSAFPDGKPADGEKKEGEPKDAAKPGDSLKESKTDTAVILIGDTDMLADQFVAQVQNHPLFGRVMNPGPNLAFIQNSVEQFAGDNNLITVRSRATLNRPFTVVRKMEEEAERSFRERQKGLEKELQDTQTRLNELQAQKSDKSQRLTLSPEQQKEVDAFKKKQSETRKELRNVSKQLRRNVDSLQTRVKLANIGLMPLLVVLAGIGMALVKLKRTSAR